jgi:hypothetical protein
MTIFGLEFLITKRWILNQRIKNRIFVYTLNIIKN